MLKDKPIKKLFDDPNFSEGFTDVEIGYKGTELNRPIRVGQLRYIVVGTGRCGTVFIAKLLSSIGIPCTHEAIFLYDGMDAALRRLNNQEPLEISEVAKLASQYDEDKGIGWFKSPNDAANIMAESSYMAAPFLDHPCFENVGIIHVVREPMKVINSFVEGFGYFSEEPALEHRKYHEFIYNFLPELRDKSLTPIDRAALYWCNWNQMIERLAKGRKYVCIQVEETPPKKLLAFVNKDAVRGQTYIEKLAPWQEVDKIKCNMKWGLLNVYSALKQIPSIDIRKKVANLYRRYYSIIL